MAELGKVENLFLKICDMDYTIIALKLDENVRKFLEEKDITDYSDSKYFIFNTSYGLKSGSFADTLYNEPLVDLIIEIK